MMVNVHLGARRIAHQTAMGLRVQTTVDTALHHVEDAHHRRSLQIHMPLQIDVARGALVRGPLSVLVFLVL